VNAVVAGAGADVDAREDVQLHTCDGTHGALQQTRDLACS